MNNSRGNNNRAGRMSSVLAFALSVILIFTGALTASYGDTDASGATPKMKASSAQPFNNFDEAGNVKRGASQGGYVQPVMDEDPVNDADYKQSKSTIRALALSPSYTATDYITPVKNQGMYGTCWAFASMASAEGSLIKAGLRTKSNADLSPFYLTNGVFNRYTFKPPKYDGSLGPVPGDSLTDMMMSGGNNYLAGVAMAKGFSPRLWSWEDTALFPRTSSTTTITALTDLSKLNSFDYRLKDMDIFPSPRDSKGVYQQANVDAVKSAILNYGPLMTGYQSKYMATTATAFFYNENGKDRIVDHAVTIVGWDDNYSKSKFTPNKPPKDGAFKIKNSWGSTGAGEGGYFWMSYYEGSLGASYYFSLTDKSKGDTIFSLDALGALGYTTGYERTKDWMANKFTVAAGSKPQQLSSASVFCLVPGTTYVVSVYKNPTGSPESGRQLDINSGTPMTVTQKMAYVGYHTIDFTKPAVVSAGDRFTVVVEIQKVSAGDYSTPVEYVDPMDWVGKGDDVGKLISPDESFWVNGYGNWEDFYSYATQENAGNVNVKAVSLTTSLTGLSPVQAGAVTWVRGSAKPLSAIQVDAKFATGTTERLSVGEPGVTITGVNTNVLGSYTGKVSYGGKSVNVKVNVVDKVTDIRTPLTTVYLKKGAKYSLPVVVYEGNKTVKTKLVYASSNSNIVKVSSSGKLTASKSVKSKKKVTITISSESGYKKNLTVYVVPKAKKLSKLKVTGISGTINKGQYKNLKVKLTPAAATGMKVTFSSSKKSVLTVDKAGKVFAKKKGTAYVTVKAGGKTWKKKVKVK